MREQYRCRRWLDARFVGVVGVVVVLGLAACSGEDSLDSQVVSSQLDSVVETEPESPSTSEAPVATASTTTTEQLSDDEAAVLEAVRRFFEERPDQPDRSKTPDEYPDFRHEYMTDPILTRVRENDAKDSAAGITEESYASLYFLDEVDVGADEAKVTSCDLSRDATFSADGELLIPSASLFSKSDISLVREDDGAWRVREWLIPQGDEKLCDPVLLWGGVTADGKVSDDINLADVGSDDDVAELLRRFDAYVQVAAFVDERDEPVSASDEQLRQVATRHELYYLRDYVDDQLANPDFDTVQSGWEYRAQSARVSERSAQILMCAAPDLRFLSPEDGSVIATDDRATWSIVFMHLGDDEVWRVEYFWFLGDVECEI